MKPRRQVAAMAIFCLTASLLLHDVNAQASHVAAKPIPGSTDILQNTVSLTLSDVRLGDALLELRRSHNVSLAWSADIIPADKRVSLRAQNLPLSSVFSTLLAGTGLQVVATRQG